MRPEHPHSLFAKDDDYSWGAYARRFQKVEVFVAAMALDTRNGASTARSWNAARNKGHSGGRDYVGAKSTARKNKMRRVLLFAFFLIYASLVGNEIQLEPVQTNECARYFVSEKVNGLIYHGIQINTLCFVLSTGPLTAHKHNEFCRNVAVSTHFNAHTHRIVERPRA